MGGVGIGKPGDGVRALLHPTRKEINKVSRALSGKMATFFYRLVIGEKKQPPPKISSEVVTLVAIGL